MKKISMRPLDFSQHIQPFKTPKKSFTWWQTIIGIIITIIIILFCGGFQLILVVIEAVISLINFFFGPPQVERLKAKRNIPKLIKALFYKKTSNDPKAGQVRFNAAAALAEIGDISEIDSLIVALNDVDFQVVEAAAQAIATLVFNQIRQPISAAYQGRHPELLPEKLALLQQIQLKSLLTLIESFQRTPSSKIVAALGMIAGPGAAAFLIEVLKGKNTPYIQSTATYALLNTGDPRAVEPLINALNHPDKFVQLAAIKSLGGFDNHQAVEPLLKMLIHTDGEIRKAAAASLSNLGEIKWQQWVMGDSNDFQRLTRAGDPQALNLVLEASLNSNIDLRRIAVAALADGADIQDERIKNRLFEAIYGSDKAIWESAFQAIAKLGND